MFKIIALLAALITGGMFYFKQHSNYSLNNLTTTINTSMQDTMKEKKFPKGTCILLDKTSMVFVYVKKVDSTNNQYHFYDCQLPEGCRTDKVLKYDIDDFEETYSVKDISSKVCQSVNLGAQK
ncbi:MAG: hypothetical protein ISR65_02275 [Bacteriovoracaceae bacterium]|nr:hypothetical protein [Bacteriovoracaceae bacterium]